MQGSSWHSYPKIFNLGHSAVRDLLNYPHVVQEKIDGSQFSFGLFEEGPDNTGELRVRSKGAVMIVDAPEKMFNKAVETVKKLKDVLHIGWTYRGEYLAKPAHNTLHYDRVPKDHIILFDVSTGDGEWLTPRELAEEGERIGLEVVPILNGDIHAQEYLTLDKLRHILDNTQSVLGGNLIEGVVIKPLVSLYGVDGKTLMGKFVPERFKESHVKAWRENNPTQTGVIDNIVFNYSTEARWRKAIQHLREAGQLEDSPRDIGKLLIEVEKDLGQEEKEAIQKQLWKWAWPHIARGVKAGFPEFYKNELLRRQFEAEVVEIVAGGNTPETFDAEVANVDTERSADVDSVAATAIEEA